jgi:hypothetical protein
MLIAVQRFGKHFSCHLHNDYILVVTKFVLVVRF